MLTNNENGFSLIELAVSAAILITLAGTATAYYTAAADKIEQQAADLEWIAAEQQAQLDSISLP